MRSRVRIHVSWLDPQRTIEHGVDTGWGSARYCLPQVVRLIEEVTHTTGQVEVAMPDNAILRQVIYD